MDQAQGGLAQEPGPATLPPAAAEEDEPFSDGEQQQLKADRDDADYDPRGEDGSDGAGELDGDVSFSDASPEEEGDSDSSDEGWGRKRKRKVGKKRKEPDTKRKPPPDTLMRRKLRSAGPSEEELEARRRQQEEQENKRQQQLAKAERRKAAKAAEAAKAAAAAVAGSEEGTAAAGREAQPQPQPSTAATPQTAAGTPLTSIADASAPGSREGSAAVDISGGVGGTNTNSGVDEQGRDDDERGDRTGGDEDGEDVSSEDLGDEKEELGEPTREVSEEEAAADYATVHSMWEFAAIVEFLFRFRGVLRLQTEMSIEQLAWALVRSPGPGLLTQLHMELLAGVLSNPKTLSPTTWAANFGNKLKHEWLGLSGRPAPPFRPTKGREAHDYAALPVTQRVMALKALCDIRLDREDLRTIVEAVASGKPVLTAPAAAAGPSKPSAAAAASSRRPQRGAAAAPPPPAGGRRGRGVSEEPEPVSLQDVRKEPLGVDSAGNTYWLLDCWDASKEGAANYGIVLYREHPGATPKATPASGNSPAGKEDVKEEAAAADKGEGEGAKGKGSKGASKGDISKGKSGKGGKQKKLSAAEQERQRLAAYVVPPMTAAGRWEKLADGLEQLEESGTKLKRSAKKQDAELASKLLDLVVPSIRERQEQEERWQKAREKMAKQLGSLWGADTGRSMRQRKAVNYNLDEYDNQIRNAIRAQNRLNDDAPPAKAPAQPPPSLTARGELLRRQKLGLPPKSLTRTPTPEPETTANATQVQQGEPGLAAAAPSAAPAAEALPEASPGTDVAGASAPEAAITASEVPFAMAPAQQQQQQRSRMTTSPTVAEPTRRTTRPHAPRSYNTDAFDEEIRNAIRAQNDPANPPGARQYPRHANQQSLGQPQQALHGLQQEQLPMGQEQLQGQLQVLLPGQGQLQEQGHLGQGPWGQPQQLTQVGQGPHPVLPLQQMPWQGDQGQHGQGYWAPAQPGLFQQPLDHQTVAPQHWQQEPQQQLAWGQQTQQEQQQQQQQAWGHQQQAAMLGQPPYRQMHEGMGYQGQAPNPATIVTSGAGAGTEPYALTGHSPMQETAV